MFGPILFKRFFFIYIKSNKSSWVVVPGSPEGCALYARVRGAGGVDKIDGRPLCSPSHQPQLSAPFLTSPPCPRCHGVQRGGRHGWGEGKQQQEENEERPHDRMAHLLQHRHDRRVRASIPPLSPINKKGGEVRRSLKNGAVYRTLRALLTGAQSACSAFCAWRSLESSADA